MRTEPFVGYRAWRIFDWQNAVLGAAFKDYRWEGPRIRVPADDMANLPTGGGFHAFTSVEQASEYVRTWFSYTSSRYLLAVAGSGPDGGTLNWQEPQTWVFGRVRGGGVVVEHEHGWRASDVMVDSLSIHPLWDEPFRVRLADRYQCDVTADADKVLEMRTPQERAREAMEAARRGQVAPSNLNQSTLDALALYAASQYKSQGPQAPSPAKQRPGLFGLFGGK